MIAYAYEYHNNKVKCDDLDLAFFSIKTSCHTCKGKLLFKVLRRKLELSSLYSESLH